MLSLYSPALRSALADAGDEGGGGGGGQAPPAVIVVPGVPAGHVSSLLELLYTGEAVANW